MKIETFSSEILGEALAAKVASDLRTALETNARASIAVSGGSTPAPFLAALSNEALDWERVTVTLTDERQVAADNTRSNARLVSENLLQGDAAKARFISLYTPGVSLSDVEDELASIIPLDVCVLGMGDDMHTASLFPGTSGLAAMLDPNGEAIVASAAPPTADEPRVTLTAKALTGAAHTYLLIKGASKRTAFEKTMVTEPLAAPIRAILDKAKSPVIFYAD